MRSRVRFIYFREARHYDFKISNFNETTQVATCRDTSHFGSNSEAQLKALQLKQ